MTQVHTVNPYKRNQIQGRKVCTQFTQQNGVGDVAGAFV